MDIPASLIENIKKGKCVLFLGAGASIQSGGCSGTGLAEYIHDTLCLDNDEFDNDLALYTEKLLSNSRVSRKELETKIKNRLLSLKPSIGFKKMSRIPWKSIYTTNYDMLLDDAYKTQNFYNLINITKYNQYDTLSANEVPLYKIHGCISEVYDPNKPLIISYSDIEMNKEFRKFLISRLTNDLIDTMLFVGYSFADSIINDLLDMLKDSSEWVTVSEKFAVIPNASHSDSYKFKAKGINVIEAEFDSFFTYLSENIESDFKSKLRLLRKNLEVKMGDVILKFDPQTKALLDTYFEYFNNENYPNDVLYFYRGGKPSWGNILNNLDIPRNIRIYDSSGKVSRAGDAESIIDIIEEIVSSDNPKMYKIKLTGPAAVGKTTLAYRICYELTTRNIFSLIYRDIGDIRRGLLPEIFKYNNESPFVIFIDTAASVSPQISSMYREATEKSLPIVFVLITREADWNVFLDTQIRRILDKFDYIFRLEDKLTITQSELLVENLIKHNAIKLSPEFTKKDLVSRFKNTSHLMVSLMEAIENTSFDEAISDEYDSLNSDFAKNCYGVISLICRHGLPFKWELLQRTLNSLYDSTWEDFINKIVKFEAKDIIKEEGVEPNFYYITRHSYISEKIVLMHFRDNKSDELDVINTIIKSINKGTVEEKFIGRYLRILVSSADELGYSFDNIINLINTAIEASSEPSFLLHVKGQYLLDNNLPQDALRCFDKNIEKQSNEMYSLHSAGMACFSIAKTFPTESGKRFLEFTKAKKYFLKGLQKYDSNVFFYKSLLHLFCQMVKDDYLSDDILILTEKIVGDSKFKLHDIDESELKELEELAEEIFNYFK